MGSPQPEQQFCIWPKATHKFPAKSAFCQAQEFILSGIHLASRKCMRRFAIHLRPASANLVPSAAPYFILAGSADAPCSSRCGPMTLRRANSTFSKHRTSSATIRPTRLQERSGCCGESMVRLKRGLGASPADHSGDDAPWYKLKPS